MRNREHRDDQEPAPPVRLEQLGDVLVIEEIAPLYRMAVATVRKHLTLRTFKPRPFAVRPFRWLKQDVAADLASRRTTGDDDEHRRLRRRRRRPRPAPAVTPPTETAPTTTPSL